MAISVVKRPLSGMADHGLWINTSGATDTATLVHECRPSSTAAHDIVYIYTNNTASNAIPLIFGWGNTNSRFRVDVPARAYNYPVIEGQEVWGIAASTGTHLYAGHTSATQSSVQLFGYYTRYTEA